METTTRRGSESTAVAAGMALVLAGCAALSLAVADAVGYVSPGAEGLFTLAFLVGWVLLAWAAIVGGVVGAHLLRAAAFRHRPALIETVLVVATAAVVVGVIWAYPLVGSGEGVG